MKKSAKLSDNPTEGIPQDHTEQHWCEHCFRKEDGELWGPSTGHWSPEWAEGAPVVGENVLDHPDEKRWWSIAPAEDLYTEEKWQEQCTAFYAKQFADSVRQTTAALFGEKKAKNFFVLTNDGHSKIGEAQGLGCCETCVPAWLAEIPKTGLPNPLSLVGGARQCKHGLTCGFNFETEEEWWAYHEREKHNSIHDNFLNGYSCQGEGYLASGARKLEDSIKGAVEFVVADFVGGEIVGGGMKIAEALGFKSARVVAEKAAVAGFAATGEEWAGGAVVRELGTEQKDVLVKALAKHQV